jgi:uncharacterized protein YndB with AHSA1/START domain
MSDGQTVSPPDLSKRPLQLTAERDMAAPPDVLFHAWTQGFDQWFAEPGTLLTLALVNTAFFFETVHREEGQSEGIRQPHYGRFLGLEQDRLVEITWVTGPMGTRGAETVVTVELIPHGTGTHLKLTHAGFVDEESRDAHKNAWPFVLELLDEKMAAL